MGIVFPAKDRPKVSLTGIIDLAKVSRNCFDRQQLHLGTAISLIRCHSRAPPLIAHLLFTHIPLTSRIPLFWGKHQHGGQIDGAVGTPARENLL